MFMAESYCGKNMTTLDTIQCITTNLCDLSSYVIQPSSMYAKPSKHKFFMPESHAFTEEEQFSAPPPSYQQASRQRSHSNMESCRGYNLGHPGNSGSNCVGTQGAKIGSGKRNSVPSDTRSSRGVSFGANSKTPTAALVNGGPEPPAGLNKFSPFTSQDNSCSDIPLVEIPTTRRGQGNGSAKQLSGISENQHLPNSRGGKLSESDGVGVLRNENVDPYSTALNGRGSQGEAREEEIALGNLCLSAAKDSSQHAKSFLVNVDYDGSLSVGTNNRL